MRRSSFSRPASAPGDDAKTLRKDKLDHVLNQKRSANFSRDKLVSQKTVRLPFRTLAKFISEKSRSVRCHLIDSLAALLQNLDLQPLSLRHALFAGRLPKWKRPGRALLRGRAASGRTRDKHRGSGPRGRAARTCEWA